jgi:imidazolonepropionase-like amidohydrolase
MRSVCVVALLIVSLPSLAQDPPRPARKPVAIKGARIHTVSGAVIDGGVILIEGARIKSVGKDVPVPPEATVIDAAGKVVIPGLVDTGSSLFVSEVDTGTSGSAEFDVLDALDTFSDRDREVVQSGVTTVLVRPLARGPVNGLEAVLHLVPGRETARFVIKRTAAIKFTLGFSGGDTSSAAQRIQDAKAVRQMLEGAKTYKETWDKYRKDLAEYQAKKKQWDEDQKKKKAEPPKTDPPKTDPPKTDPPKSDPPKSDPPKSDPPKSEPPKGEQPKTEQPKAEPPKPEPPKEEPKKPSRPRVDPRNEALVKALDGLPVHIEAHAADSIEHALEIAAEFKLKLVLEGATDAHAVADAIAKAKVPVILGPVFRYGIPRVDYLNHTRACAAALAAANVDFAIGSFGSSAAGHAGPGADRFLMEAAASTVAHGLSRDRALRAITLDAAKVLALDRQFGSVDANKAADLVILTGEPFDADTRVDRVLVSGETVYQRKLE